VYAELHPLNLGPGDDKATHKGQSSMAATSGSGNVLEEEAAAAKNYM